MTLYDTHFGKQSITIYGGGYHPGRTYWLHQKVDVFFRLQFASFERKVIGTKDRNGLQKSLTLYAEKIQSEGARIIKQTKNKLIAQYNQERLTLEIK